ncbi:hypothetical protein HPG69_005819, partial [Diceros bicornis minor]
VDAEKKTSHDMDTTLSITNNSRFQVSKFILMGFPGIREWQHWLSLPLGLLYLLPLCANLFILITIQHEPTLHQPMHLFLGISAVVDIGLATTIVPKILAIFWFDAKAISLPELLRLNSAEATSKALNACSSHLILILFFYTVIIVVSVTHLVGRNVPFISVVLNVLHSVIPPALNPMTKSPCGEL